MEAGLQPKSYADNVRLAPNGHNRVAQTSKAATATHKISDPWCAFDSSALTTGPISVSVVFCPCSAPWPAGARPGPAFVRCEVDQVLVNGKRGRPICGQVTHEAPVPATLGTCPLEGMSDLGSAPVKWVLSKADVVNCLLAGVGDGLASPPDIANLSESTDWLWFRSVSGPWATGSCP